MTWILGAGVTFGYGALISDVRAVWPDGRHLDILQKIHPVGPWMMAGFSGSVEFGFETIADMQHAFGPLRTDGAWMPKIAAWRWHRRARRAFASAPQRIQELRSSILLVGVSPEMNGPFHFTRCIRMRSPLFEPEFAGPLAWLSVGSGSEHMLADDLLRQDMDKYWNGPMRAEIYNPGGGAAAVAYTVVRGLRENPIASVSPTVQVGRVWRDKHEIQALNTQFFSGGWSNWALAPSIGLATSWNDFRARAEQFGLTASAAAT
jgi:hypothetical protein